MIGKMRRKFIILSVVSIFVLLAVIITTMNVLNYVSTVSESDEILFLLSQNKGKFPGGSIKPDPDSTTDETLENIPTKPQPPENTKLPPHLSPELPYESRYFSVLIDANGNIQYTDISKIAAINEAEANEYASAALKKSNDNGFLDSFRYLKHRESEMTRIIFLDCGRRLDSFYGFLYTSLIIAFIGFSIVSLIICFFAKKIIHPIAESYEKQKRFITDAGHEIKTPLTIIKANADILEMEFGENESIADIKLQTKRLTKLTNELVYLARMEEAESSLQMIDFPLSDVVSEVALSFKTTLSLQNKKLELNIRPMLSMRGNNSSIEHLVSILLDNAMKYCPSEGTIYLELSKHNRAVMLKISNPVSDPINSDDINKIFDRFYRTDSSRNSETGGYGIGLSIAQAIVKAHNGKIYASAEGNKTFKITALLPL